MTELRTVSFRSRDGVHEVKLPELEARLACRKHPWEWSPDGKTFADPPEGWQPSEGDGGGSGRIQGASVRAD